MTTNNEDIIAAITEAKMDILERIDVQVIFNSKQAGKYLGISQKTLSKRRDDGEILAIREGAHWHYRKQDLDDYLERKAQKWTAIPALETHCSFEFDNGKQCRNHRKMHNDFCREHAPQPVMR